MPFEYYPLTKAAAHVHVDERELRHAAQRGEIQHLKRGDGFFFERKMLDEWAQRRIMGLPSSKLAAAHRERTASERVRTAGRDAVVQDLLAKGAVEPCMASKTKPGLLRDIVELSDRTGNLFDPAALLSELEAREEAGSTAVGGGAAFLHARFHDPYLAAESFITLARTPSPLFFGAQDGEGTDIFFLVCCTDHAQHLHALARLCILVHGTGLLESIRAAETAEDILRVVAAAEDGWLGANR